VLEGSPVRLAENGRVEGEVLLRHAVSLAALEGAVRGAGLASATQARLIVLEPNGKITVLKDDGRWSPP